jgi:xanthine dehydrogenase accessory factor
MDIFEEIVEARKINQPLVMATVIQSLGSAPREEGARMLVRPDGTIAGTIGGGAVEQKIIEEAMKLFSGGPARLFTYELKNIGMECGGGMSVLLEPLVPAPQLVIFGAGHIGACLAQMGKMLEFHVVAVDNRPEFANAERLPWADAILAEDYLAAIDKIVFTERTFIIILTHKHAYDFEVLEKCLAKKWSYLGMIGSKVKVAKIFEQLKDKGVTGETIKKIHAPVGVRIGANTPAEIAISILAEIVQVRSSLNAAARLDTCCSLK